MILDFLFWGFYAGTVILWFKDSFPLLKQIPLSPLVPFAGFMILSILKLIRRFHTGSKPVPLPPGHKILVLAVILILAIGVRIPWLIHGNGINTSDDAISMLMAKHISEGKLPPIYYYGQLYQGSLFSHITAAFILVFGYSALLTQVSILFFYLAFIVLQFIFLDKLFSFALAASAAFFYSLPIGDLVYLSFFSSAAFPLVLFMGSLILFLSVKIVYENKTQWIPVLGFIWGLSFWTHQITVGFIVTSAVILFVNWNDHWKKYLRLPVYAVLGGLPLMMAEIFWQFPLLDFLLPGSGSTRGGDIIQSAGGLMIRLFSRSSGPAGYAVLAVMSAGGLILIYPSIKAKRLAPQSLFSLFFFIFPAILFLSGFGDRNLIRYLYPLYFCLPVLLLGSFEHLHLRFRQAGMVSIILFIFFGLNYEGAHTDLEKVKTVHRNNSQVISAMKKTGKRYWRGEFWTAYLLTALSGEDLIIDSFSVNRYYPYKLQYENNMDTENYIFNSGKKLGRQEMADRFVQHLNNFDLDYMKQETGNHILVFDIKTPVWPGALLAPVHPGFPFPKLSGSRLSEGFLDLTVVNSGEVMGSDYWLFAEIPEYCSAVKKFPAARGKTTVSLPAPAQDTYPVSFHLNYKGLKMAHTETHMDLTWKDAGEEKRNKKIVYLSGFGTHITLEDTKYLVCFRKADIEIKRKQKGTETIQLDLYSPFDFKDPAWYGDFSQEVEIRIDGELSGIEMLHSGNNIVTVSLPEKSESNPVSLLTLWFKYHAFFDFAPYEKIAALLGKITIY
jgi:hypothetical protein